MINNITIIIPHNINNSNNTNNNNIINNSKNNNNTDNSTRPPRTTRLRAQTQHTLNQANDRKITRQINNLNWGVTKAVWNGILELENT